MPGPQFSDLQARNAVRSVQAVLSAQEEQAFIMPQVVARVQTNTTAGKFSVWDAGLTLGHDVQGDGSTDAGYTSPLLMADQASYPTVEGAHSSTNFDTDKYGAERRLSDLQIEEYAASYGGDLKAIFERAIALRLMIEGEKLAAAALFASGTFTNSSPGTKWGAAGADSIGDIDTAADSVRQGTGVPKRQLTCVLGQEVANALRGGPELTNIATFANQDNGRGLGSDDALADALMRYWGVGRVVIGGAVKNTANEGQTVSGGDIWGDHCFVGKLEPGANSVNNALTMFDREPLEVVEVRNPKDEGPTIRGKWNFDLVVPRAGYGYLLTAPAS